MDAAVDGCLRHDLRSARSKWKDDDVTTSAPKAEWLTITGDPDAWRAIGLTVGSDGLIPLFGTSLRIVEPLTAASPLGLTGWAFSGISDTAEVAGFPAEVVEAGPPLFAAHELGAAQLDHVVIFTADMDAVSAGVESATGCERRRVRELETMRQGFHRIGRGGLIVEIVEHADGNRTTEMWGVVVIVDDLDAACALLGDDRVSAPKDAVQPGRRIATIRAGVGLGCAVALMSA